MALCEVVVEICDLVEAVRRPLTSQERSWLHAIRGIVWHRDKKRLDLWETECNEASPAKVCTETEELLAEVEMLGMCNLYQAFQEQRTREYYARLEPFFCERGILLPSSPDLSGW
jgi:hypothetical protein